MAASKTSARLADTCMCRNMICLIISGVLGIILTIGGGIILGIGFGTVPADIWDTANMAMRIAGLIMVGFGVVLINIAILSIIFYVKRSGFDKAITKPIYIDKSRQWVRGGGGGGREMEELKVPLDDEYTTGSEVGPIYRGGGAPLLLATPGGDNDSVFKYNSSMRQDDISFSSQQIPVNRSAGSQSGSRIIEEGVAYREAPSSRTGLHDPPSYRPTPSPRPPYIPPQASDTSSRSVKNPSTASSATTSRDTKPSRPGGRMMVGSGSESEEPQPSARSSRSGAAAKSRSPEVAGPRAPVVPVSYRNLPEDDMVTNVTVSVKPAVKKKKKSGKAKNAPAPEEMYGGLGEGEEPIPPRVTRGGREGGASTPETILMSSDIEEDFGPEEELAPPPPSARNKRSNVR